ncbi:hypothetical protein PAPHI01_1309 [Pancytospora philotis]|nr:hypothetical protein PAPHI01_1309 [Pancytospora philotis]
MSKRLCAGGCKCSERSVAIKECHAICHTSAHSRDNHLNPCSNTKQAGVPTDNAKLVPEPCAATSSVFNLKELLETPVYIVPGEALPLPAAGGEQASSSFIQNKRLRSICFSKRKASLLSKAKALHEITGAQILLVVASDTGRVYSFATEMFAQFLKDSEYTIYRVVSSNNP